MGWSSYAEFFVVVKSSLHAGGSLFHAEGSHLHEKESYVHGKE